LIVTIDAKTHRQPIRRRMLLSLTAGVVVLVVLGTAGIFLVAASHATFAAQSETLDALSNSRRLLIQAVYLEETDVLDYELTHAQRASGEFDAAARSALTYGARLADLSSDAPQLAIVAQQVSSLTASWHDEWAAPLMRSLRAGNPIPTSGSLAADEGQRRFQLVENAFSDLDRAIEAHRAAVASAEDADTERIVAIFGAASAIEAVGMLILAVWLVRVVSAPLARLSRTAADLVQGTPVSFRAERDDEIGTLATVLEQLRLDVEARFATAVSDAEQSATYNKLADLISFSATEDQLVDAAVRAIRRLTAVESGHVALANPSQNRLVYAALWGEPAIEVGRPVPIDRIDRCPGIRRASAYLVSDVEDDLAVRCPAHDVASGAAACIPMMALGQVMGVIHLALTNGRQAEEAIPVVTRVAEQIAVALANARLMKTLEGLAMTDAMTGLHNARFFDSFLDQQLAAAERDSQPLGLIMLDIDHFKQFNDTHGHPAGDEALRAFSRAVRSVVRASDVIARYGGEEFMVVLPGSTEADTRRVAEKIRKAVEEMVIEIGPGRYARTTVSAGVVATDAQHLDRKGLVAMVDAALYRAKEGGRNRVANASTVEQELETAAGRRRGGEAVRRPIPIDSQARSESA
jgi:diguanylate cyclase (GGDEF)-like protein